MDSAAITTIVSVTGTVLVAVIGAITALMLAPRKGQITALQEQVSTMQDTVVLLQAENKRLSEDGQRKDERIYALECENEKLSLEVAELRKQLDKERTQPRKRVQ